jgi:hypothetical protein
MEYDQTYGLEIEFAKYIEDWGWWPSCNIRFSVLVKEHGYKNNIYTKSIQDLLLDEYGEYTITCRLYDEAFTKKYDQAVFPSIRYEPALMLHLNSPADLCVTDPQGRHVGVDPSTGQVINEIPDAVYTGPGSEPQVIAIPDPLDGDYAVLLIGRAAGTYSLTAELVTFQGATAFNATDIPTAIGALHNYNVDWSALSLGEEGVVVQVDSDGDGVFEHTFTSDSLLTQSEYLIAVDEIAPQTWLSVGMPKSVDSGMTYLTSATPIMLTAEDNLGGLGVASTAYRIYSDAYDSYWRNYTGPFNLSSLTDGNYTIAFNSTDNAGNTENTNSIILTLVGPDINGDGVVDGSDLIIIARAFGSYGPNFLYPGTPQNPRWNPIADINFDGVVDGCDLILTTRKFGHH